MPWGVVWAKPGAVGINAAYRTPMPSEARPARREASRMWYQNRYGAPWSSALEARGHSTTMAPHGNSAVKVDEPLLKV